MEDRLGSLIVLTTADQRSLIFSLVSDVDDSSPDRLESSRRFSPLLLLKARKINNFFHVAVFYCSISINDLCLVMVSSDVNTLCSINLNLL